MRYHGVVQKGKSTAGMLGFPTINISLPDDAHISGIFAAIVRFDNESYPAAAYADQKRSLLEAHVLDFSGDLYGREVEIELLEKIREDAVFEGDPAQKNAALKRAIEQDVAKTREFFKN